MQTEVSMPAAFSAAAVYCPSPVSLLYLSSFQPDGKSIAADIIFTRSPTINGYKPKVKAIVLNPVRQQSQSSPNE